MSLSGCRYRVWSGCSATEPAGIIASRMDQVKLMRRLMRRLDWASLCQFVEGNSEGGHF